MVLHVKNLLGKYIIDNIQNNSWIIIEVPHKVKRLFINNKKIDIQDFPQFEFKSIKNLLWYINEDTEIKIKKIINVGNVKIKTMKCNELDNMKIGKVESENAFIIFYSILNDINLDKDKLEILKKCIIETKSLLNNSVNKEKFIELERIINIKEIKKIKLEIEANKILDGLLNENYYINKPNFKEEKKIINIDQINTLSIKKNENEIDNIKNDKEIGNIKNDKEIVDNIKKDTNIKLCKNTIEKNHLLIHFKKNFKKYISIILSYLSKLPFLYKLVMRVEVLFGINR